MAAPHNKARYGETWPQYKIDAYLAAMEPIRPYVAFSGGWAWHFLSPKGHVELKHAHDHKDADLMVPAGHVGIVLPLLLQEGFKKVGTKYDKLPSAEDFRRYERIAPHWICPNCYWAGSEPKTFDYEDGGALVTYCPDCEADCEDRSFRITIDFFVKDVPVRVIDGWMVVEPTLLLTFYSTFHSSKSCFAVTAAKKLLEAGIDPQGRPELCEVPHE